MFLGRVFGNLQATVRVDGLDGVKFLWVRKESSDGAPHGPALVACDGTMQAGPGDLVYLVDGREAGQALPVEFVPADATIVGIVDAVEDR